MGKRIAKPRISTTPNKTTNRTSKSSGDAMLMDLPLATYRMNAEGWIVFYNAAAAKLWGRRPALGKTRWCGAQSLYSPDGRFMRKDDCPVARALRTGMSSYGNEIVIGRADGTRAPIASYPMLLRDDDGRVVGALAVLVDLSAQTNPGRRAAVVIDDGAAERTLGARPASLAAMSREPQAPSNSIDSLVDLLAATTELTRRPRRRAETARSADASPLTVVDDIANVPNAGPGRRAVETDAFSPAALLDEIVSRIEPVATDRKLTLACSLERGMPDIVTGDRARLRQVLLHLLGDAVTFTPKDAITLTVRRDVEERGDWLRFSIADTGMDVHAAHAHVSFRPLARSEGAARRQDGAGLGLAVCKRLVHLMDGEIGMASDIGHGSTVWFTARLPRTPQPAPAAAARTGGEDPAAGSAGRILVVDDAAINLEIVQAYLQEFGYRVDCVDSGLEAIQMLGSELYDLILMDIQMPLMDGVTATKRIRALTAPIGDIPIIAMTGNTLPQQVRSFLEAGMNDHVGKPIERAKLCSDVQRWLPKAGRAGPGSGAVPVPCDRQRFETFVLDVGREKAELIAERFLAGLTGAFKSTWPDAQREARALASTARVFGLDGLAEACRHAAKCAPFGEPHRSGMLMEELRRSQAVARRALVSQLMPGICGAPLAMA